MRTSCSGASRAEPRRAEPSRAEPRRAAPSACTHACTHADTHTRPRVRAASTHAYAYAGRDWRRRRRNSEPRIDRDAIHSQPISPRCRRRNVAAMQQCNVAAMQHCSDVTSHATSDAALQRPSPRLRHVRDAALRGTLCASAFHPAASASTLNIAALLAIAMNTDYCGGGRGRALP
jgi:hypothetical protein